ncbi:MAG TPA: hypothetical protein VNW29_01970 [Candidatus Sulfotelmatobacter sp.]|nr:hypothetical protein [Candidatus Sulfotelmatobacter sp.]
MSWKQPILTGLESIFGEDYRCMQLYKELIYRANNTSGTSVSIKKRAGVSITVILQRGEVLYGRIKFASYLVWDDKTCDRALIKLEKVYKLVTNKRTRNYTVVTIKNYNQVVDMTKQMSNIRPTFDQDTTTSNNDKSENIASGALSSLKKQAWENYSLTYFKSLGISDPAFIEAAHQAFMEKGKASSERTVKAFIDTQKKITPPDTADYIAELWPEEVANE